MSSEGGVRTAASFVGRRRELDELEAALEDALAGRGRLFLISGEPGIGKSRLAEELANRAVPRGAAVLVGRCWEAGGAPAFWPWVQAIRAHTRDRDRVLLRSELGSGGPDLAQIVPELRELFPDLPESPTSDPEAARFRLFDAVGSFLRRAAQERAIVLVLDDLHAADESSLLLLRFVARDLGGSPLLVLGVYRDVGPSLADPLASTVAELGRESVTRLLPLSGLDDRDTASFIELTTAHTPGIGLVETVQAETDGNPLFVGEIVRLLDAEGRLDETVPRLAVPQSLKEVIRRRLGHLSAECNQVLALASVLGREFDLDVLARVSGLDRQSLLEQLYDAIAERVLSETAAAPGRFRFGHVLFRDALYEQLPPSQQRRLHGKTGAALEDVYAIDIQPHLAELAHHFVQADAADRSRAFDYARRAADRAMVQLAYEEAVRLYRIALETLESRRVADETLRCELLLSLGDAEDAAGNSADSQQAFLRAAEIARSAGTPRQLARAALGYGGRFTWMRPAASATELTHLVEEALGGLDRGDSALRALLLARLATALRDDPSPERRRSLVREAVAIARRLGDPLTLFHTLMTHRMVAWAPENAHEHLEIMDEIVRLADEAGDPGRKADARLLRTEGHLIVGDFDTVWADLDEAGRLAAEARRPTAHWHVVIHEAFLALLEGRFAVAEPLIAEMAQVGEKAQVPEDAFSVVTQTFALRWGLGGMEEIEGEIERLARERRTRPFLRCLLAVADLELGKTERARGALENLAADDFSAIPRDSEWMLALVLLVEVAAAVGDVDLNAVLYRLLEPYGHLVVDDPHEFSTGSAARTLGIAATILGRFEDAEQHFRDALAMNERIRARPWLARTQLDYAHMLLVRRGTGDSDSATVLLQSALSTSRELGMVPLVAKTSLLLSELEPVLGFPVSSFAGYRLGEEIGRGGMGIVYRATELALDRPVALKLIAPELAGDPSFRERFLRESRLAASIDHPGILPVYAAGEADGELYLATRYVDGTDLRAVLAREGKLSPERVLALVEQVAYALDAAHRRGLVHRDVKPGNVLVDGSEHCYLADFGLTKQLAEGGTTASGLIVGSLDYLAPEQIRRGAVDGRTDEYALGCVLYECLSGAPPFRRESEAQTLWAHMQEQPAPMRGLPELDAVFARALAKEPDERYETCAAFVEDARSALGLGPSPVAVRRRRVRVGRRLVLLGVALIAIAALAIALSLTLGGTGALVAIPGSVAAINHSIGHK